MRKFFLFSLFIIGFLCAGFLREDLQNSEISGVKNYNFVSYTNSQNAILYGQTISANACDFNLDSFLIGLDAHITNQSDVCGRNIVYAYAKGLSNFVYVNGNRVNLQIALDDERVYIGYPLIMGSF